MTIEKAQRDFNQVIMRNGFTEAGIANFQYADCIPMDCDNDHSDNPADWKSPEDVRKAFPGVAFAVSFSRNHMKEKCDKAARPKFHCYFPIGRISSAEQYVAMKKAEGVTEDLKMSDQLRWVGMMNNIKSRAEEIVLSELIYV